ncbi:hypothetical protein ACEPAG_4501 [Sanghuangporus baumii]
MGPSAAAAVARVAFICSDVVVDRQSIPGPSLFSDEYKILSTKSVQRPQLVSVPDAADSASYVQCYIGSGLVSLTSASTPRLVSHLLPYLSELAPSPFVLHIAVSGDLSDVLLLRSTVPYFIHSSTLHQAYDNALVASKIARIEKRLVIHAFQVDVEDVDLRELTEEQVRTYLADTRRLAALNGSGKHGLENGHGNGHAKGLTNGHANGSINGHANGSIPSSSGWRLMGRGVAIISSPSLKDTAEYSSLCEEGYRIGTTI